MSIDLREFASGDTDYISKMNSNVATLEEAINAMQSQLQTIAGANQLSVGALMQALFSGADALIGPGSYLPTPSGSTLNIAEGGMYLSDLQTVAASFGMIPLSFAGAATDTYYIFISPSGSPSRVTDFVSGCAYSVYWNGSSFSGITRLAPVFYDTTEAEASRANTALATTHSTLDARLEAGETVAKNAQTAAAVALAAANAAMDAVESLDSDLGLAAVHTTRKVGCLIDATTGVKGAIQVDFEGTIIGWSVIADVAGTLSVEIDKKASSVPPAVPQIPNTTTDKISASAPIALSSAQSAARDEAGVSTWSTAVDKWDVIQFNVVTVTTITRATLYLRIQETPPDVAVTTAFILPSSQPGIIEGPYGPFLIA